LWSRASQKENDDEVTDGLKHEQPRHSVYSNKDIAAEANKETEGVEGKLAQQRATYVSKAHGWLHIKRFLFICILGTIGFFLYDFLSMDAFSASAYKTFLQPLGALCLFMASCAFVWACLGFFQAGRNMQFSLIIFMRNGFMKAMLIILLVIYIPITEGLVSVFNCEEISCPAGTRFRDIGSVANVTNMTKCIPCNPMPNMTKACDEFEVCPAVSNYRHRKDPSLKCNQLAAFFWPAAFAMVLGFVGVVPLMHYKVTRLGTDKLSSGFPIHSSQDMEPEELWSHQCAQSNIVSIFLFEAYTFNRRWWSLWMLVPQTIIVLLTTFEFEIGSTKHTNIAMFTNLVVHGVILICQLVMAPYQEFLEKLFTNLLQASLVTLIFVCSGQMWEWFEVSSLVIGIIVLINLLLILVSAVISVCLLFLRQEEKKEPDVEEFKRERERRRRTYKPPQSPKMISYMAKFRRQDVVVEDLDGDERVESPPISPKAPAIFSMIAEDDDFSAGGNNPATDQELQQKLQETLEHLQAEANEEINSESHNIIRRYFLAMSLLCLSALMLCGMGYMSRQGTVSSVRDPWQNLGKYHSWEQMSTQCCCNSMINTNDSEVLQFEKWICPDMKKEGWTTYQSHFERIRVAMNNGSILNGLIIRGMCSEEVNKKETGLQCVLTTVSRSNHKVSAYDLGRKVSLTCNTTRPGMSSLLPYW